MTTDMIYRQLLNRARQGERIEETRTTYWNDGSHMVSTWFLHVCGRWVRVEAESVHVLNCHWLNVSH